jgi:glycosyltransferase involved in cell wall biosynthesis
VARAVVRALPDVPRLRLLLVGPVPDRAALDALLARVGAAERTVVTGRLAFAELPAAIEAADIVVHLRWPTARETSAALLRVLAQGRPCLVSDLQQQSDLPDDAVLRVDVADEEGEVTRALLRLAASPALRARLGAAAAAFVAREHSALRCRAAWEDALSLARVTPSPRPRPGWPAHWKTPS